MRTLSGSGALYRCGQCDEMPMWQVQRTGDLATEWACTLHLHDVCWDLQRDFEMTKVTVTWWTPA